MWTINISQRKEQRVSSYALDKVYDLLCEQTSPRLKLDNEISSNSESLSVELFNSSWERERSVDWRRRLQLIEE